MKSEGKKVNMFAAYDGSVSEEMPSGDYLRVATGEKGETSNRTLWDLWDIVNSEVAKFSVNPAVLQPMMTKDMMEEALAAIDKSMAQVAVRIVTRANRSFSRVYGTGHAYRYEPYPIRWAGENRQALQVIMDFVQTIFAIPQVPCNRLDQGIVDDHAAIIVRPIFDLKVTLMREWFDIEPKGDISVDELQALFRGWQLRPPLHTSLLDNRDQAGDLAAEDARALTDETGPTPTEEAMEQITAGRDVWTWQPDIAEWARFGEILRRLENAGPVQTPPEPFPFTTGVITSAGTLTAASASKLVK